MILLFDIFYLQVINFIFFNESEMYPSLDEVRLSDSPDCFLFYKIANNSCTLDDDLTKFGLPVSHKIYWGWTLTEMTCFYTIAGI